MCGSFSGSKIGIRNKKISNEIHKSYPQLQIK